MEFEYDKPNKETDPDVILAIILGLFSAFLIVSGLAVLILDMIK